MRINLLLLFGGAALVALCCLVADSARAIDLEAFEFNDSNGTELMNAANSVNPLNMWFSPNSGQGMLPSSVESGAYRVIKDFEQLDSNYLQIDNITSGKAYIVAEMANWKFTGFDSTAAEQIRFAFLNDDTGDSGNLITAQAQIGRNDLGGIELTGTAIGTSGSANISNVAALAVEQTNPFTVVLELDKDSNSFEVFYKDGTNPTQVLGLGAVSRVRDGNSIRFAVNNNFGSTNLFPTVIDEQFNIDRFSVTDTNPFTDLISLEVDRVTGSMTLINTSGAAVSSMEAISIISDVGSLNAAEWKSVAGNYDSTGDGSIDLNDAWAVDDTSKTELRESMQAGGAQDGGALTISQNVVLDMAPASAPGPWIRSPYEDVRMELTLAGGVTRTVDVNFVGNGGAKWQIGDLDFDNSIDADDWNTFIRNAETDLSSFSTAEAYQRGDLDRDGVNSVLDFGIFQTAFEAANGSGSFARMLAGAPEPSTAMLALLAALGWATFHRPIRLTLAALLLLTVVGQPSRAGIIEEFLFNDSNGTLIENAANNINPSHLFDTDSDTAAVTTNGLGQLNASLKNNTGFGSNYVDLHPGVLAPLTTGRYYGVMELTWDFLSPLDASENEEIRFTFINNDPRGTQVTAQWEIERNDNNELILFGSAIGTGASDTGETILNGGSLTQSSTFIAVVDADLDNDRYEILYSNNAGSSFQSGGTGTLDPDRGIEALRMVLNNDLSDDNVLIDRFYFTDVSPVTPVDKLSLEVNITSGRVSILNDTTSTFDIDWYRLTSGDDSLNFDGWNSLSDQNYDAIDSPVDPDTTVGNGVGETWDEAGGSDDGVLSESFLLGSSLFDPGESVSLGNAFRVGGTQDDIAFEYRDAVSGNLFNGLLTFVSGLAADFDDNGQVDGDDFLIWQTSFNVDDGGDANGDGVTDGDDFLIWQSQFGSGSGSASAAIPEPASIALLLVVLAALLGQRRVP